jgi:hypothetical protein
MRLQLAEDHVVFLVFLLAFFILSAVLSARRSDAAMISGFTAQENSSGTVFR